MNKERRSEIECSLMDLGKCINSIKYLDTGEISVADLYENIITIKNTLVYIKEDEQDAFDNLPESFQESDKGETMLEAIDSLEECIDSLDCAEQNIAKCDFQKALDYMINAVKIGVDIIV